MSDMSRREATEAKVGQLGLDSRNVNVTAKVTSVSEPREVMSRTDNVPHRVADVLIGDETGCVVLTLWDENIEQAKTGDVLVIKNGYVKTFKGSIRLNIGRFGTIGKASVDIPSVKTDNNISEKVYQDTRPPRFGYGGGGGGGRRRYSRY
jgi:replication factor A1